MEQIESFSKLNTPCYILDEDELLLSFQQFSDALGHRFSRSIVSYSIKTNSVPYCIERLAEKGCFIEVVSSDEFELARLCKVPLNKIVYNGPLKSKDTFLLAIEGGAIVNIETNREIEWLNDLPHHKVYRIGIRLNVNISEISPEDASGDDDNSRFGFAVETGDLQSAIDRIKTFRHVELSGLHLHRTTHTRSLRFYERLLSYACKISSLYKLQLDYLDVGGGYFGRFLDKPTYDEYADVFYKVLSSYHMENVQVIVEPGNALVASCFKFLTEVIDVKKINVHTYVATIDGSRNDIDPFFKKTSYLCEIARENTNNDIVEKQIIGGCTCLEYDRLFVLNKKPRISVGDRIQFNNVGAYTMCLSPQFIRYWPAIYKKNGENFEIIRKKWKSTDLVK